MADDAEVCFSSPQLEAAVRTPMANQTTRGIVGARPVTGLLQCGRENAGLSGQEDTVR